MAQTLVLLDIDGKVTCDYCDDLGDRSAVLDYLYSSDYRANTCEAYKYDFGEGESDTDTFIDTAVIEAMCDDGASIDDIIAMFENSGYGAELVYSYSYSFDEADFESGDPDDYFEEGDLEMGFNPYMGTYDFDC